MKKKSLRLKRAKAGLVVVDIQERLLPAIFEHERLIQNTLRLIKGAGILELPLCLTEQYRKGLGATDSRIAAAMPGFAPIEKLSFSACGAGGFMASLKGKKDIILCGMEAHVCILQTCLDLLDQGFNVFVVADAVSSRTEGNYHAGIERMRDSGAVIASTEMVLFELLGEAGTKEFKEVLALVR